jgi:hypothetical protein
MATFQTYTEVGIQEDISDIITNISPRKTPFLSSIGNEKIHQPLFQWQEDSLRGVQGTAAAANEGADPSDITVVPTVMRSNQSQIFVEAVKVSGSVQKTLSYGRAKELAYQMSKSAAALKRDLENAFVGTAQAGNVGSANSGTARLMIGAQAQIAAGNTVHLGAAVALNESALLTQLGVAYTAGADPTRIMLTPSNSIIVAAFAAASGRYRTFTDAKSNNIVNTVNLYVSPFGEQKVELNRFLATKNTLIYEPEMWNQATFRPWTRETLAKTGDAEKQMIIGEFSLKHKNYGASALILDNTA